VSFEAKEKDRRERSGKASSAVDFQGKPPQSLEVNGGGTKKGKINQLHAIGGISHRKTKKCDR